MCADITAAKRNPSKSYNFCFEYMPDNSLINNDFASFTGNAKISGSYFFSGGNIYSKGVISYNIAYPCDRCLKTVNFTGNAEFNVVFYGTEEKDAEYYYSKNIVDFTKVADDSIMLDIPVGIVCKESCKGLCAECGKNLNEGECSCSAYEDKNPFNILKKF